MKEPVKLPWTGRVKANETVTWTAPPMSIVGDSGPGLYGFSGSITFLRAGTYRISLDAYGSLEVASTHIQATT